MRAITIPFLLCSTMLCAQTGPGGVGTSATNVLWLRADAGVTHSSGAVSQWNDQSGNANHAVLPGTIPTATPAYVTGSVNGYPSLDFDGSDDQLWVADHSSIDLTAWHFFIVVTADLLKDYNAWMVKGNDSQENYEMLSYLDGNVHTPTYYTDGTRTFPSSAGGQVTTTAFDVIEYSYNTTVGRDVYKNAGSIHTDNESKTPQTNNHPLYIGNERGTTGRVVNGDLAEVIAFNARLNATQRLLVNNYLAAKYGRSLATGDIYNEDDAGNGDHDHDVAGLGRTNAGDLQTAGRGSGIVLIDKAAHSGLQDNEFMLWGHDGGALGTWGVGDLPTGVQGRWQRVWRVSEVDAVGSAVNVGNVDMSFDLNGLGSVTTSELRLLVDTDNDGLFADETPISGAINDGGGMYRFAAVSALQNNRRFTLGTTNILSTPLPVELLHFTAEAIGPSRVRLTWATASEQDNAGFAVERSEDLEQWNVVAHVAGAGDAQTTMHYEALDAEAPPVLLYYRLRQSDLDGSSTLSSVVAVDLRHSATAVLVPNPADGPVDLVLSPGTAPVLSLDVVDGSGRVLPVPMMPHGADRWRFDATALAPGAYVLRVHRAGDVAPLQLRLLR
ncbi:MAG: hypothetical protein IPM49_03425 [Flavobacteriales bacterium]|nr:hypothetical protein [Flavobacteriales bacterium]